MLHKFSLKQRLLLFLIYAIFLTFGFLVFSSSKAKAAPPFGCISYYTCAYQSGTGLTCQDGEQPFHFCTCHVLSNEDCLKYSFNLCSTQEFCNSRIEEIRNLNEACFQQYGDCCGCEAGVNCNPAPSRSCPKASFQECGVGKESLINVYSQYREFTAPYSGTVSEIAVRGGAYGGASRRLTCKLTNSDGSVSLREGTSDNFSGDQVDQWIIIPFGSPRQVTKDVGYRIYCKGPQAWNSVYWTYDIYSVNRTYSVYICPPAPIPTSTPTVTPVPTSTPMPTPTITGIPTPSPTVTSLTRPWFQVENCDVHSNGRLSSSIPETVPDPNRFFVNSSPGGVISSSASEDIDLGKARLVSQDSNWRVDQYRRTIKPPSFLTFKNLAGLLYDDFNHQFSLTPGDPNYHEIEDLTSGVWFITNDYGDEVVIENPQNLSGETELIIFVGRDDRSKNLRIQSDITISPGHKSSIAFIVSGGIKIDPSVKNLHGLYYSGGKGGSPGIFTGTKGSEDDDQLFIYGSLITANGQIHLQRDLGKAQNKMKPAEIINCPARYFVLLSPLLRNPIYSWEEVVP